MTKKIWIIAAVLAALVTMPTLAPAADTQVVKVTVSGMSYTPAEVTVIEGIPVRMEFVRDEKPTCGGKVVFPELEIERQLPAGETTVVEFTPDTSGELTFTCGMKMMKGKVVVRGK